jgi:DNA-binding CsgD family transcriptional regulator
MLNESEHGFPTYLPEQEAVLIGWVADEESEVSGQPVYYIHWRGSAFIGQYEAEDDTFSPMFSPDVESRVMSDQVHAVRKSEPKVELSSVGKALHNAWSLSSTGIIGKQQAHVLALLNAGFSRSDVSTILNIEPSTVDSHRYDAEERTEAAEAFVSTVSQLVAEDGPQVVEPEREEHLPDA